MSFRLGAIILMLSLVPSATLYAASSAIEVKVAKPGQEDYERQVDQVARASQEKAITKLSGLLKKYRGTHQEPTLLAKLAELQQQNAAILFRISHGTANKSGKALDLTRYNQ